eukprot:GILI01010870.1.p1 GENE.GILI01010870.1~~GILI01010870.1.p1  ORF type:complete len:738 (+),score=179.47 GILI01010870.1:37-2214(+)
MQNDMTSTFEICPIQGTCSGSLTVTGNSASGSAQFGFVSPVQPCAPVVSRVSFANNVAHSNSIGLYARRWLPAGSCVNIVDFTAFKNFDFGIMGHLAASYQVDRALLADNIQGFHVHTAMESDSNSVVVRDSIIAGTVNDDCNGACNSVACASRVGILGSLFVTGEKSWPLSKSEMPVENIKTDSAFGGLVQFSNTKLLNFTTSTRCPATRHFVYASSTFAADATPIHRFSTSTLIGVDPDSLIAFRNPSAGWRTVDDCGTGTDCTGLWNVVVQDTDGSLLTASQSPDLPLTGLSPLTAVADIKNAFDRNYNGRVSNPDTCRLRDKWNGYVCSSKYGVLMMENSGPDNKDRLVSPVRVTSVTPLTPFYSNTLNSFMDHGWNFDYTSLKRLNRFPTAVEMNRAYNVSMAGSNPRLWRMQLQGALDANDAVVVNLKYGTPETIEVWVNGVTKVDGIDGRRQPDRVPTVNDPVGTNRYWPLDRQISVVLKGTDFVLLRVVNTVQVSLRMDTNLNDFFDNDGESKFIFRLALSLGISADRIKVVDIRQGSVIVDFAVVPKSFNTTASANATTPAAASLAEIQDLQAVASVLNAQASSNALASAVGYPVLSMSVQVSVDPWVTPSSSNTQSSSVDFVPIILGVVIPVVILASVLVGVRVYMRNKKRRGQVRSKFNSEHIEVKPSPRVSETAPELPPSPLPGQVELTSVNSNGARAPLNALKKREKDLPKF